MTEPEEYNDYPKEELIQAAKKVIAEWAAKGVTCDVYFKASCPKCNERCAFTEPNTVFEEMECNRCGHIFPFTEGNYYVMLQMGGN